MPITRKLIAIGDSRGITIPKSWLKLIEKETGMTLEELAIEVNSNLTVIPIVDGRAIKVEISENVIKAIEKELNSPPAPSLTTNKEEKT